MMSEEWIRIAAKEIADLIQQTYEAYPLHEPITSSRIEEIITNHFDDWFEEYQWNLRED